MKRFMIPLAVALLAIAMPASSAHAAEFRSGDDVVIGANEVINDDLYLSGSSIRVLGTVKGDVFAVGNTVQIDGVIEESLNAAGNTVRISGRVDRTVRAAANDLTISGPIGRDLFAAGASVQFLGTAKTGGDLMLAAANGTIAGAVGRDLRGGASRLKIDGSVGRNVSLGEVETLEIGREATIAGNLQYTSPSEATVGQGARITGQQSRQQPVARQAEPVRPLAGLVDYLWTTIRAFLGLVILGLFWLWLLPAVAARTVNTLTASPLPSLGIGLTALMIAPAALVLLLLMAFILGAGSLLTVVTSAFAIGVALAGVVVSQEIGDRLLTLGKREISRRWVPLMIGAAIVAALTSLPIVGWLLSFVVLVAGLGALLVTFMGALRGPRQTPEAQIGVAAPQAA